MPISKVPLTALLLTVIGAYVSPHAQAIDKSKWPRVAPIIFVHGVGSAPPTFGVKIDKETVPANKPLFPAGDDSKTGGYYFYKPELDSLQNCHDNNDVRRNVDVLRNTWYFAGHGVDGEDEIQTAPLVETKYHGCNSSSGYWWNDAYFQANSNLTTAPNSPNYVMQYDFLQNKTSFAGRTSKAFATYDFKGNAAMPTVPAQGDRNNGIEFFDAYWTFGWPDGNVPVPLKSLTGMLYGTALSGTNHKWVKAKWSRNFIRNSDYVGGPTTGFKSYDQAGWNSLLLTSTRFDVYDESELLGGSAYAPGTSGYSNLLKSKTDTYSAADGKRTITYKYSTYVHSGIYANVITVNYVVEDKGYTGDMLPEETPFGQVGQLYIFVKKVLDKYYKDSNGSPNWYLGNGMSDPDARIVLVGHSQGGVISRAVCYPGFQSGGALENGYEPIYYPKSLASSDYLDWDGTTKNMNGCWFDIRNHIAGVVSISSPHYGSPIGYAIDGVYAMHKNLLDKKALNEGLYYSIWNKSFLGLDNYTVSMAATEVNNLIGDISPVATPPTAVHEGFNETIRAGLRTLHNYSSYKTQETMDYPIPSVELGRMFWEADKQTLPDGSPVAPASAPCEVTSFPGGIYANHYRLYWQPEYDNWVRAFRLDESNNGGPNNELVHTTAATQEFIGNGVNLCREQIGRFTRLTQPNYPTLGSQDTAFFGVNPLGGHTSPPLGKVSAASSVAEVNADGDIKALTDCLKHMVDPVAKYGSLFTGLFIPPIVNPFLLTAAYEVYDNGTTCIDQFKVALNQTTQGFVHGYLTNAAQGLAYHPASVFLHRLNQRGGTDALAAERRPAPARADNTPIPFISVVDNLAATSTSLGTAGAPANGDLTVNTLSQDIGFAYPDLAKSGSVAKFSITGISHTMAPTDRDTVFGGYFKANSTGAWVADAARNRQMHQENRTTLSRLFFGLAIGQSPVLANQGPAGARLSEIEGNYTQKDAQGFTLQRNDKESVQGKYSRLKGINPDEVLEPVALPYSSDRTYYLIDRVIVVNAAQELYVPAGARVVFTPSGTLIVKSGGRLTLGGVPSFAGSAESSYGIHFVSGTSSAPDIRLRSGSHLKFPDPGAGLLKSAFYTEINGGIGRFMIGKGKVGPSMSLPSGHLWGQYDSQPYAELIADADKTLFQVLYYPGALNAVNSLLQ